MLPISSLGWSRRTLLFCFLLLVGPPALAHDLAAVVQVVDGDTLDVTLNGKTERIRLIGVDTPEKFDSDKLRRDVARTGQDEQTIKALGGACVGVHQGAGESRRHRAAGVWARSAR
jgi:hypothetical protein